MNASLGLMRTHDLGLLFSSEDEDLATLTWRLDQDGYARTTINRKPLKPVLLYAHREVCRRLYGCKTDNKHVVDHINQNKLDNRRENLRITTKTVNRTNSGVTKHNKFGVAGLCWLPVRQRWKWEFYFNGAHYQGVDPNKSSAIKSMMTKKHAVGYGGRE